MPQSITGTLQEPQRVVYDNETIGRAMAGAEAPIATPPIQLNKIRDINIHALDHGYVVNVGCQTVAIEKTHELISRLIQYLNNPAETERLYSEGKLF